MYMRVHFRKIYAFPMDFYDFLKLTKQIRIILGHIEIILGLLWVSEGHFGSPGGLRGCTFGSSEHDSRSPGRLGRLKFGLRVPGSAR